MTQHIFCVYMIFMEHKRNSSYLFKTKDYIVKKIFESESMSYSCTYADLAKEIGCSRTHMINIIQMHVKHGWLEVKKTWNEKSYQNPNTYVLTDMFFNNYNYAHNHTNIYKSIKYRLNFIKLDLEIKNTLSKLLDEGEDKFNTYVVDTFGRENIRTISFHLIKNTEKSIKILTSLVNAYVHGNQKRDILYNIKVFVSAILKWTKEQFDTFVLKPLRGYQDRSNTCKQIESVFDKKTYCYRLVADKEKSIDLLKFFENQGRTSKDDYKLYLYALKYVRRGQTFQWLDTKTQKEFLLQPSGNAPKNRLIAKEEEKKKIHRQAQNESSLIDLQKRKAYNDYLRKQFGEYESPTAGLTSLGSIADNLLKKYT